MTFNIPKGRQRYLYKLLLEHLYSIMHLPKSVIYPVTDLTLSSVAQTPRPEGLVKILTVECIYYIKKLYKSEPNLIKVMEKETVN